MRRAPSPSRAADLEGSPSRSLSQPEEPSPPAGGRDPPSSLSLSDDIQMGDGANSFCSCWREGAHDMALAPTDTASCSGRNSQARTHAHVHRSNARKDVRFDRIQEHQRACVCVRQPPPPHTCMAAPHVCICMCVWQRVHGVHACTHARTHARHVYIVMAGGETCRQWEGPVPVLRGL